MPAPDDLTAYIASAPKAELHVHTVGSVRPHVMRELARRNGAALPIDTVDGLDRWITFRDFNHFQEIYRTLTSCIRTLDDLELIGYELGVEMTRQNIRYAEVNFTQGLLAGTPFEREREALNRGRLRAEAEFGVTVRWIIALRRALQDTRERRWFADYVTELALAGLDAGVVALGLAGGQERHPARLFAPWFERAKAGGLRSAPHAGEHAGPQSVWDALTFLGADRIAHGVRAMEDATLVAHLAATGVALDVCPTSNVLLGVFPSLSQHPLPALHNAGVTLTINSDDPPLFGTTLTRELELLAIAFSLDADPIDQILLNGVRCSFLPESEKLALTAGFEAELEALRA